MRALVKFALHVLAVSVVLLVCLFAFVFWAVRSDPTFQPPKPDAAFNDGPAMPMPPVPTGPPQDHGVLTVKP